MSICSSVPCGLLLFFLAPSLLLLILHVAYLPQGPSIDMMMDRYQYQGEWLDSAGYMWYQEHEKEIQLLSSLPPLSCRRPTSSIQPFTFIGGTYACRMDDTTLGVWPKEYKETPHFYVREMSAIEHLHEIRPPINASLNDFYHQRRIKIDLPINSSAFSLLANNYSQPSLVGRASSNTNELDLDKRRSREIAANQIRIDWPLESMIVWITDHLSQQIMEQYHISTEQVTSGESFNDLPRYHHLEPHKMLLYEEGDFFSHHRDTYKEAGMYATLIILLPTEDMFEGGQLIVNRNTADHNSSVVWDWRQTPHANMYEGCPDEHHHDYSLPLYYAAFYTDCDHELLPVTSGHRVALVYNVFRNYEPVDVNVSANVDQFSDTMVS